MPSILSLSLIYLNYPVPESRTISGLLSLSLSFSRPDQSTQVNRNRESEGGTLPLGLRLKKNVLLFERLSEHDRRHTAVFSLTRTTPTTLFRIDPFPFLSCSFPSLSPLFALLTTVFL